MLEQKKAVLFDVDDTLYDQTVPFMRAYAGFYGADAPVPADLLYPVTRKYSDQVFHKAMSGEMTMDEMYIYRVKRAFHDFGTEITDDEALAFQRLYAEYQNDISMSCTMEKILGYCSERASLQTGRPDVRGIR